MVGQLHAAILETSRFHYGASAGTPRDAPIGTGTPGPPAISPGLGLVDPNHEIARAGLDHGTDAHQVTGARRGAAASGDARFDAKLVRAREPELGAHCERVVEPEVLERIARLAKRIYRTLELDGYARIDFRLSASNVPYFLDANPNPDISDGEEIASAAALAGMSYGDLITRILNFGIKRGADGASSQAS